ncbi:MAG: class I SAM-dependent methyltransferase [Rubrivivax sp.]|jgi:SAM-dependent methyltransferase
MQAVSTPVATAPVVKKYGKSSSFYLGGKNAYFEANDRLLADEMVRNALYLQQPLRSGCKICGTPLQATSDFVSHGVAYHFCEHCGHLNGAHEETQAFLDGLYTGTTAGGYATGYIDKNYQHRAETIYVPKVEFLLEQLEEDERSLLDVGCGSGHFVYACLSLGLQASGVDVGEPMINFGNTQIAALLDRQPLVHSAPGDVFKHVLDTRCKVVSAIGVIEHLKSPAEFFAAFQASQAEYLYYSVPMFSTSVVLENAFPSVYPRQLAGGHTHLFTESSLREMHARHGVAPVAEWRFGTDMMDLYRALLVKLAANGASNALVSRFERGFGPKIDAMQAALDGNDFCSEIHCLVRKQR